MSYNCPVEGGAHILGDSNVLMLWSILTSVTKGQIGGGCRNLCKYVKSFLLCVSLEAKMYNYSSISYINEVGVAYVFLIIEHCNFTIRF